ncbi:ABC transporter substrate-binding protein [Streptomyces daqingensis]|uniref:ABC transporter substrate-binding protein n=1 Tax=Streptomyces daqingensis TaxID=1472640 RepID=UPI001669F343|nr:ABC transporter substrate-binding protein [Streptomyces daqingensis]
MSRPRSTSTVLVTGTAVVSLLLSGCTGTEGTGESTGAGGRIDYLNFGDFGGGAAPKPNYNPFLDAVKLSSTGYIFERLYIIEGNSCKEKPWLASAYEWETPERLVFDIRPKVKWNDGRPFTADDVAFTFDMIKKHPALDTKGAWANLKSVDAQGQKVVFTFKEAGASSFTAINEVPIVPEHIWSKVKDPKTFTNAKNPVGTGPMKMKSFSPKQLVTERNPRYWQAEKVKVNELRFNKTDAGGQVEQLKLSRGEYDQQGLYVPDIEKTYVKRDPEHHKYWYAPGGAVSVYMNLTKAPFKDVRFRRALTKAFDHQKVVSKAQLGYVTHASQSGLIVPGQKDFLPRSLPDEGRIGYDPKAASAALTKAGYKRDSQGRRLGKDGKPISFSFKVPGSYNDWVASAKILTDNMKALGLQVDMETPTPTAHEEDRATGNYEMTFGVLPGTCNNYTNFADPLSSEKTAPIGEKAPSNTVRWKDARTDKLLDRLRLTVDRDKQKQAVAGLVDVMMTDVPMIPVWYGAKWFQYKTTKAEGWPDENDPYAAAGDNLVWLTHLKPAKD